MIALLLAALGPALAAGVPSGPAARPASGPAAEWVEASARTGAARPADGPPPAASSAAPAASDPALPPALVDVLERIPDAILDLRYATENNFLKKAVYPPTARCFLRRGTAERLARVAERLRREDGTRLILYDCYRPRSVQRLMWEIMPVRGYVAPPERGSVHNRGGAVDLGLAAADGSPLPMPTPFDEFSRRAWHSYQGGSAEERRNRQRLREAMLAEGFQPIRMEWWHYEDPDERRAPLLDHPFPTPAAKTSEGASRESTQALQD